jgi:hypothetical protein
VIGEHGQVRHEQRLDVAALGRLSLEEERVDVPQMVLQRDRVAGGVVVEINQLAVACVERAKRLKIFFEKAAVVSLEQS